MLEGIRHTHNNINFLDRRKVKKLLNVVIWYSQITFLLCTGGVPSYEHTIENSGLAVQIYDCRVYTLCICGFFNLVYNIVVLEQLNSWTCFSTDHIICCCHYIPIVDCPNQPLSIVISNLDSRTLTINWDEPFNNNEPITGYLIRYQNPNCLVAANGVPRNVELSSTEEQIAITGLHPGEPYRFSIIAVNSICTGGNLDSTGNSPIVRTLEEGMYVMVMVHDDIYIMIDIIRLWIITNV